MATKNIVPRADGEGSIGKTAKKWFQGFFKKLTVETELTAPTVTASDSSTKVATTAHVKANVPKSVGSGTKPVYTDSNGKVTASNSSVGDTDTPIYMSGGTLTAMSETLFSKIVTHLASATAATISSLNTSSLFYRMLTWALTASGVQYNLTNSSAWYVCLGSLFGGLIIQGGTFSNIDETTRACSTAFPVSFTWSYKLALFPQGGQYTDEYTSALTCYSTKSTPPNTGATAIVHKISPTGVVSKTGYGATYLAIGK